MFVVNEESGALNDASGMSSLIVEFGEGDIEIEDESVSRMITRIRGLSH